MPTVPAFQGDAWTPTNVAILIYFVVSSVVMVYNLVGHRDNKTKLDELDRRVDRQGGLLTAPLKTPTPAVQVSGPAVVQTPATVSPPEPSEVTQVMKTGYYPNNLDAAGNAAMVADLAVSGTDAPDTDAVPVPSE